jgi:hypothetical protein
MLISPVPMTCRLQLPDMTCSARSALLVHVLLQGARGPERRMHCGLGTYLVLGLSLDPGSSTSL